MIKRVKTPKKSRVPLILEKPDQWQLAFGPRGWIVCIVFVVAFSLSLSRMTSLHWHDILLKSSLTAKLELVALVSLIVLGLGIIISTMRVRERYFLSLESIEDMSERLGARREDLEGRIRGQDIQPRYIVNGRKLYDRKDLGDAATLLRGSTPPAEEISLLKPAAALSTETENLVRPA